MRLINLFGAVVALLSLVGCERHRLDQKLEELCKKDSGVKVYETVTLSQTDFMELKKYAASKERENVFGPNYRYERRKENWIGTDADTSNGKGRLMRWYAAIYRRSDNKLLGESIDYGTTGSGGFADRIRPSGATCSPRVPDIGQSVFIEEN
jgi:hypothetical protein